MTAMISEVNTIQSTIQASSSGMPNTSGSTRFKKNTPPRMAMNGRSARRYKGRMRLTPVSLFWATHVQPDEVPPEVRRDLFFGARFVRLLVGRAGAGGAGRSGASRAAATARGRGLA